MKSLVQAILRAIFLFCILTGCTFIPEHEQLVSSAGDYSLKRHTGHCSDMYSPYDIRKSSNSLQGLTPESIAILDWNIYKAQRQNWDTDFVRLSREKDIILLQEASLNERLRQVLFSKDLYWNLNSAFKFKGVDTGVLMASTSPPLVSCGLRHGEPFIGVPKTILIGRYSIMGSASELLVANIHGINFSLGIRAYRKQFDTLYDILKKHAGPIILAGDFNNWNEKRNEVMAQLAGKLSLQSLKFVEDYRTSFFGDPVDHILYRGLQPVTRTVHEVTSSDHNPISVTFRFVQEGD